MLTRVLARVTVALTTIATGVLALASPAVAQEVVCSDDGYGGQICYLVVVVDTGDGWTVEVQHQSGGEYDPWCLRPSTGRYVACEDPYGWFNAETECYISRSDEEPHEDMPGYEEYGDDGVAYDAFCFHEGSAGPGEVDGRPIEVLPPTLHEFVVLGPDPEGYGGTPSPLPGLIEDAINSLQLDGADIHLAPSPDGAGLVGLPVWMATPETEQTWGPQPRTAGPVAGMSVTATAQAQNILWEMGNGDEVLCENPGTIYESSYGVTDSPTCGYPGYREPSRSYGGAYPITATTTWTITWTATNGANGEFDVTTGSTTAVVINELQVLTTFR